MLKIRKAGLDEYGRVRAFYHQLIDDYADSKFFYGWKKEVYPSDGQLRGALAGGELYVGEAGDGALAACMVLNHAQHEGYRRAKWSVAAEDAEVLVVHLLGVAAAFSGRGLAKEMTGAAIREAEAAGAKTLRLDVLDGNLPAERAYVRMGFRYVETLRLLYEDTGLTEFRLLEYVI